MVNRDWLILSSNGIPGGVTVADVLHAVASQTGFSVHDLKSHKRNWPISKARHIAMYLADEMTRLGRSHIARQMGGRDHTTVKHGCKRIAEKIQRDDELRDTVNACRNRVISR